MQVDLSKAWAILALAFVVLVPLLNEAWDLYTAYKLKNKVQDCDEETLVTTVHHVVEPQTRPHVHHGVVASATEKASPTGNKPRPFSSVATHSENGCSGGSGSGSGSNNDAEKVETTTKAATRAASPAAVNKSKLKRHVGDSDISYVENGRSGDEPTVALETRGTLKEMVKGGVDVVETCESEDSARQSVF